MANSSPKTESEHWIREVFLPKQYGQTFHEKSLPLQSRGVSTFAAVSDDGEIVAAICTSPGYASNGKPDKEALMKVQSDALKILWLENTPAKRFMIFTDPSMIRLLKEEKKKGHFPKEIELVRVKLPTTLDRKLEESRKANVGDSQLRADTDGNVG
jgi:hypothetical protein